MREWESAVLRQLEVQNPPSIVIDPARPGSDMTAVARVGYDGANYTVDQPPPVRGPTRLLSYIDDIHFTPMETNFRAIEQRIAARHAQQIADEIDQRALTTVTQAMRATSMSATETADALQQFRQAFASLGSIFSNELLNGVPGRADGGLIPYEDRAGDITIGLSDTVRADRVERVVMWRTTEEGERNRIDFYLDRVFEPPPLECEMPPPAEVNPPRTRRKPRAIR